MPGPNRESVPAPRRGVKADRQASAVGKPSPGPGTGGAASAPARRARKKAATRTQILNAATRLFWEQGYEATSIHEITETADVAFRTFYLHFATKADVAIARFEEWLADMVEALWARPPEEKPDAMLAGALAEMTAKGYAGDRVSDTGIPLSPVPFAMILAEDSPEVAGRMFQAMTSLHQDVTAMFRERLGYGPNTLEPRIVAATFFATFIVTVYGFAEALAADPKAGPSNELGLRAMRAYVEGVGRIVDDAPATRSRAAEARTGRRPQARVDPGTGSGD